jgi:hypothetical protein
VASHFGSKLDPNAPKQPEPLEDDGNGEFEDVSDEEVITVKKTENKLKKSKK